MTSEAVQETIFNHVGVEHPMIQCSMCECEIPHIQKTPCPPSESWTYWNCFYSPDEDDIQSLLDNLTVSQLWHLIKSCGEACYQMEDFINGKGIDRFALLEVLDDLLADKDLEEIERIVQEEFEDEDGDGDWDWDWDE